MYGLCGPSPAPANAPSSSTADESVWDLIPHFAPADFDPEYPPLQELPTELLPFGETKPEDIHDKRFFGFVLPSSVFLSYAEKHGLCFGNTHRPVAEFGSSIAMRTVAVNLSLKLRRVLTTCVPIMADHVCAGMLALYTNQSLPWYFFTWEDDEALMERIKEELGLPAATEAVWCSPCADFDVQESLDKPSLERVEGNRNKRLRKLQKRDRERRARKLRSACPAGAKSNLKEVDAKMRVLTV